MQIKQNLLRQIPSVDEILKHKVIGNLLVKHPRRLVVSAIRKILDKQRKKVLKGEIYTLNQEEILTQIKTEVEQREKNHLRRVINATGVVVHTNLGRSLLAETAIEHLVEVARYYNNLEYDLDEGKRGSRYSHIEPLLCELTGAEAAMVVNNNAGAVFLTLNTLAYGKKVVISRGQLVEIGGSFRIPDVMAHSGAILVEVGTTNRTHLYDYENAIDEDTAILMKAHTSNYKIVGFTKEVPLEELVTLAHKHDLIAYEDLGSGNFVDFSKHGLEKEPTVQEVMAAGVDVVSFSGDKLLGGPQAGIILGKKKYIEQIKKNPLNRALRIDKFTLAALESTLKLYRDEEQAIKEIPTLRLIFVSQEILRRRAQRLRRYFKRHFKTEDLSVTIKPDISRVGGGALPTQELPTFVVGIKPARLSVSKLEERLRFTEPPLIGRIEEDMFLLDVRTIQDEDLKLIPTVIKNALAG
ncbi:MAG: L-seryl-tRNA(Sec) selenium transferase [Candidatus Desulfofervidaceae bacterium]|nr:L-seryl-tRNA(Sec) selenium transferase [Candidatus Desulfofervidaceae bacterium]